MKGGQLQKVFWAVKPIAMTQTGLLVTLGASVGWGRGGDVYCLHDYRLYYYPMLFVSYGVTNCS